MGSELASSLERSLSDVSVTSERIPAERATDAIADAVKTPAIGVSLDELDVSLDGAPVTVDPTPRELRAAKTGVTAASLGIADYGTLVLPQTSGGSELASLFVDRHVAVLPEREIVPDMDAAFQRLEDDIPERVGSAIMATGPSATADMGALVRGAHGPSEVHVIILTEGQ